jgi:hypothetical protein
MPAVPSTRSNNTDPTSGTNGEIPPTAFNGAGCAGDTVADLFFLQ